LGKQTSAELKAKNKTSESGSANQEDRRRNQIPFDAIDRTTHYERLFQYTPVGILLMDADGRYVDANQKALEILGYRPEQLLKMTGADLIHPDNLVVQPLITPKDIADPGREITLEREYLCYDGRYLPVEVHLRVISKDLMITTFRDISQSRGAEKALQAAKALL
jgi:hypothetical protein